MAAERDFELLDDYLTNRLNAEDKAYIESRLSQDPELQREYSIQKNIADGLRSARKAELKAMLNSVPIPASNGASTLSKFVGAGTVALIVGVAAYFYVNQEEKVDAPEVITDSATQPTPEVAQPETSATVEVPAAEDIKTPAASTEQKVTKSVPSTPKEVNKPKPYDPTSEATEDGGETDTSEPATGGDVPPPAPEFKTKVVADDKYKFHYQLKGDHVTLYGPFADNLYEILDFQGESKHTVFLFYKNAYYLLTEEASVRPLKPVNDPTLLKKLREYRNN